MSDELNIAEQEPATWGPAMSALSERRRAFVVALYDEDAPRKGDGLIIYATQKANYGSPTSSRKSLSVIGNRIVHDDRVQAAIVEYSQRVLRAIPPEAIQALKSLIRDPKHRDHACAIAMVLDRSDPLVTNHNVKVQDDRFIPEKITEQILVRIEEIAARYNLNSPRVIDGDFSVVEVPQ
jgi:hypothetical protein